MPFPQREVAILGRQQQWGRGTRVTLMNRPDFIVVGGGIVGLSTAWALGDRQPGARILVLEKEATIAAHQTGRNSGVIHSGVYYRPGSLKGRFAVAGNRSMVAFCERHGIPHEVCGKVIVATREDELPRLRALRDRGRANGLDARIIGPEELREVEPHVRGLEALRVPSAGIVDFAAVARTLARLIVERRGEIRLSTRVLSMRETADSVVVETDRGRLVAGQLVNCGGLHADRLARAAGIRTDFLIVPFRGEYFELKADRRQLVRNLVYPVLDPDFPFLGVHLTRMIDGAVHAGPNAVMALSREGYRKADVSPRDTLEALAYGGFWRLARRHFRQGVREMHRSVSREAFARSLQRLVPEVSARDLVPSRAGVRAQALTPAGDMVDDFLFAEGRRTLHVCNAPSPAATASLEIGAYIAERRMGLEVGSR